MDTPWNARGSTRARRNRWSPSRDAREMIHEITLTAERISEARHWDGELIFRSDARWSLLRAIERAWGCPSISDLGRMLRISRQAAYELVRKAELASQVELVTNHDDRRILQVLLAPGSKSMLKGAAHREAEWALVLLNGLDAREVSRIVNVLRVIRQRLAQNQRELEAHTAGK